MWDLGISWPVSSGLWRQTRGYLSGAEGKGLVYRYSAVPMHTASYIITHIFRSKWSRCKNSKSVLTDTTTTSLVRHLKICKCSAAAEHLAFICSERRKTRELRTVNSSCRSLEQNCGWAARNRGMIERPPGRARSEDWRIHTWTEHFTGKNRTQYKPAAVRTGNLYV